jgi:putative transposase
MSSRIFKGQQEHLQKELFVTKFFLQSPCRKRGPEFAKWLDANADEGLTVFQFPKGHWKKLRTSNGIERVAVLFTNKESALRLVTGVIIEIHEEWVTGKQYLDMTPLLGRDAENE